MRPPAAIAAALILLLPYIGPAWGQNPGAARDREFQNGMVAAQDGNFRTAIALMSAALREPGEEDLLKRLGNEAIIYAVRGEAYFRTEQYARSAADFTRFIELFDEGNKERLRRDPGALPAPTNKVAQAYANRAAANLRLNQLSEALADMDMAIELDGSRDDFKQTRRAIADRLN